jgi:hypothetical protein
MTYRVVATPFKENARVLVMPALFNSLEAAKAYIDDRMMAYALSYTFQIKDSVSAVRHLKMVNENFMPDEPSYDWLDFIATINHPIVQEVVEEWKKSGFDLTREEGAFRIILKFIEREENR